MSSNAERVDECTRYLVIAFILTTNNRVEVLMQKRNSVDVRCDEGRRGTVAMWWHGEFQQRKFDSDVLRSRSFRRQLHWWGCRSLRYHFVHWLVINSRSLSPNPRKKRKENSNQNKSKCFTQSSSCQLTIDLPDLVNRWRRRHSGCWHLILTH